MTELYHGDCLNVMKDLPEESIDLILCDLPYACDDKRRKQGKGQRRPSRLNKQEERAEQSEP